MAVARYRPDGAIDPSFGTDGVVGTDVGPGHNDGAATAPVPRRPPGGGGDDPRREQPQPQRLPAPVHGGRGMTAPRRPGSAAAGLLLAAGWSPRGRPVCSARSELGRTRRARRSRRGGRGGRLIVGRAPLTYGASGGWRRPGSAPAPPPPPGCGSRSRSPPDRPGGGRRCRGVGCRGVGCRGVGALRRCRSSLPGRWPRPPMTCPPRRGAVTVGPLVLRVSDPLGLAEQYTELAVRPGWWCTPGSTRCWRCRARRRGRPATAPPIRPGRRGDDSSPCGSTRWATTCAGSTGARPPGGGPHGPPGRGPLREVAAVLLDTRAAIGATPSNGRWRSPPRWRPLWSTTGAASASSPPAGEMEFDGARPGPPGGHRRQRWAAVLEHLALVAPDAGGADAFALAVQSIRHQPSGRSPPWWPTPPPPVRPRRPPLPPRAVLMPGASRKAPKLRTGSRRTRRREQ